MRQPSTPEQLLAWHSEAVRDAGMNSHEGDPQCGWYKMQMVSKGPWVPVLIWCDAKTDEHGELTEPERFRISINGEDAGDPASRWTWLKPITFEEYERIEQKLARNRRPTNVPINLALKPTRPGDL